MKTRKVEEMLQLSRRQLQHKETKVDLTSFYFKGPKKNSHKEWHEDKLEELKLLIEKTK